MKKIYKKILLIISCFVMMICSLSFINLSTNDNDVRYESIRRYSVVGTEVPNTGYVEKVYFNTNLSDSDIYNLLGSLTYFINTDSYMILFNNDMSKNLFVAPMDGSSDGITDLIYCIIDENFNLIYSSHTFHQAGGTLVNQGWNLELLGNDYYLFDDIAVSSLDFGDFIVPVGEENELIKDLVSITPFVQDVEENTIINDLLSSIGLGITSIVGVVVNGIKESFLELVYVDKDSDNLVVSDLAYFLFAMLGFSIAVGLIWLVIFMFKRRE